MPKKTRYSVKYKVFKVFLVIMIPFALILVIYGLQLLKHAEEVLYNTAHANLIMYSNNLENEMESIDVYLSNIVLQSKEIKTLSNELENTTSYLAGYEIFRQFSAPLEANNDLSVMMLYSEPNQFTMSKYSSNYAVKFAYDYKLQSSIEKNIGQLCASGELQEEEKFYVQIDGRPYFYKIKSYKDVYCIALIDIQILVKQAEEKNELTGKVVPLVKGEMVGVELEEERIEFPDKTNEYIICGEDKQYMSLIAETDYFQIGYLIPNEGYMNILGWSEGIIIIFILGFLVMIPNIFWLLKNSVYVPLKKLETTMEAIATGNLVASENEHYESIEFEQVNQTFNRMLKEIKNLKIESYEKEIEKRKVEFQYLQLQIRPHFYLNCMKNMYGLAESMRIDDIKKNILLLSNYLRYIFAQKDDFVAVKDEIWQCQNYIDLIKSSRQLKVELILNVDADLLEVRILPISILTFVENSVKYAARTNEILQIEICVKKLKITEDTMMQITVYDNGNGFSEDVLQLLNKKQLIVDEDGEKHIGIQNVIQRFEFMYQKCEIVFMNRNGAKVVLIIPIKN